MIFLKFHRKFATWKREREGKGAEGEKVKRKRQGGRERKRTGECHIIDYKLALTRETYSPLVHGMCLLFS